MKGSLIKTGIVSLALLIGLLIETLAFSTQEKKMIIDVFYKNRTPSQKTLEQVKPVLEQFSDRYTIRYHDIEAPTTEPLIEQFGLPDTHFPFAIVFNGIYSARMGDEKILFVEFPTFMAGIGRHEGNWSLEHLKMVLEYNSLLTSENFEICDDHSHHTTECED